MFAATDAFHVYDTTLRDGAQGEGMALTRRRQAGDRPAPGRPRGRLHRRRLARRAAEGHRVLRPRQERAEPQARPAHRVRRDPPAGGEGGRRPAGRGAARLRRRCGLPGRQEPRPPRHEGAAHHAGREPRDDPRHRRSTCGPKASGSSSTRSTSSTATSPTARTPSRWCATAAEAGADVVVLCDTNGGMLPAPARRRRPRRPAGAPAPGSASTATTTPGARSPTRSPRSRPASRTCRASSTATASGRGNANLVTRGRQPRAEDGPPGAARPAASPSSPGSATRSPRSPTSRRSTQQPYVGAVARSRTRPACTPVAIKVDPDLYQHIDPALVGNDHADAGVRDGRPRQHRAARPRARHRPRRATTRRSSRVVDRVKELEAQGYTFEAADASFELLLRDEIDGEPRRYFTLESWRVIVEQRAGRQRCERGDGQGPRQGASGSSRRARATVRSTRSTRRCGTALDQLYPRAGDAGAGRLQGAHPGGRARHRRGHPGAGRDQRRRAPSGTRSASHENVIAASWQALDDAVTYGLLRRHEADAAADRGAPIAFRCAYREIFLWRRDGLRPCVEGSAATRTLTSRRHRRPPVRPVRAHRRAVPARRRAAAGAGAAQQGGGDRQELRRPRRARWAARCRPSRSSSSSRRPR